MKLSKVSSVTWPTLLSTAKKSTLFSKIILMPCIYITEPVPVKAENLTEFYTKSNQHQKDIAYKVNSILAFE